MFFRGQNIPKVLLVCVPTNDTEEDKRLHISCFLTENERFRESQSMSQVQGHLEKNIRYFEFSFYLSGAQSNLNKRNPKYKSGY